MADGSVIFDTSLNAKGFEKGLSGLAKGAAATAAGVTAALGGMATAAISVGSNFEASMSQVAATMGLSVAEINAGSESFEILSAAAKEAGESTAFSASEAAEGLNYLALAGYDAATAAEVLPSVLNLAAAGGMDLAYASDLATDAMAALGIEAGAENLTTFGDKMAKTASKANTSVAQLGEAILTVGGTAKVLAGGTTELNTVLGLLANEGTKGSEAGTALRNVILSLTAPTDKAAAKIKELELNVADANGDLRPLNDIFKDLNASLDEMSSTDKTKALNEIFNKVDLKSVQTLLANCGEQFDNLSAAIDDSGGAMQQMADVQLDNLKGDLTILGSAAEGLGVAFYENIKGTAREAVQSFTNTLSSASFRQSFDELSSAAGGMIQTLGKLANDALPVLIDAFTFLATNLTTIIGLAGGAYAAFKTFTTVRQAADWVYKLAQNFGTAALQIGLYTTANGAAAVSQGVLNGTFSVFEVVVGVLTGKVSLATAAQWAWNAAMSANPIGLVLAAVGALAAGIGIYTLATRDGVNETQDFVNELQQARGNMENFTDSIQENVDKRADSMRSTENETALIRTLADELFDLNEQEDLSAQNKVELASKVQMLNDLMPELNLALDEETGRLTNQKDEVYSAIEAWEKLAKTKAAQEMQVEIYKERIEAERQMQESGKRLAELEQKRKDLVGGMTDSQLRFAASCNNYNIQQRNAAIDAQKVNAEIEKENQAFGELQSAYESTGEQLAYYSRIMQENYIPARDEAAGSVNALTQAEQDGCAAAEKAAGSLDGLTRASFDTAQNAADAGDAVADFAESARKSAVWIDESTGAITSNLELSGDALEAYQDQLDGYTNAASNMFSQLDEGTAVSVSDIIANLEANQKAVTEWSENLKLAAERGINQGLLEKLREAGPASAAQVRELVNASDEELTRLNEVFGDAATTGMETFNNVMESSAATAADAFMGPFQELPADLSECTLACTTNMQQTAEKMGGSMEEAGNTVQTATDKISDSLTQAADTAEEKAGALGTSITDAASAVAGAAGSIQQSIGTADQSSATVLDGALAALQLVADTFGGANGSVGTAASGIQTAAGGIQGSFSKVNEAAQTMHKGLTAELKPLPGEFGEAAQQSVDSMNTALINGQPTVQSNAQGVKDSALNAVNLLPDELYTVGVNAVQGLGNGMLSKSGWLANIAAGIVSKAVAAMKDAADIHSPSRRAAKEIGAPLVEGIGAGMDRQFPQLAGRVQSDISSLLSHIRAAVLADQAFHPAALAPSATQNNVYNDSHNNKMDIHVHYQSAGKTSDDVADISRQIAAQAQWRLRAKGVLA